MTTELFGKKVNKYNINNFLLQLVATGVACLELPKKNRKESRENKLKKRIEFDDSVFLVSIIHDYVPKYVHYQNFWGMHLFWLQNEVAKSA